MSWKAALGTAIAASFVSSVCVGQPHRPSVTAIICPGVFMTDYHDPARETRIYIIDDERETLAQFDPLTGGSIAICADKPNCRKSFGPTAIMFDAGTSPTDRDELTIDRQNGTIHIWDARDGQPNKIFKANCVRTNIPAVSTAHRKF